MSFPKDYIKIKGRSIEAAITLFTFKDESGYYIAFIPAFDIMAQGTTEAEAISEIKEIFSETIDYMIKKKTLESFLLSHNWKKEKIGKKYVIEENLPLPDKYNIPPAAQVSRLSIA